MFKINFAEYKGSFTTWDTCPKFKIPEVSFIGRSNVGKSSLINMLCGRKDLVRVSNTPGKTQSLNFFLVNDKYYMVDMPGYGFARVSQEERKKWKRMIDNYCLKREQLVNTFVLVDARHEPQKIDIDFIKTLGGWQTPFAVVFTKADKVKSEQLKANRALFEKYLLSDWETLPPIFVTSSEDQTGKQELLDYMEKCYNAYVIPPKKKDEELAKNKKPAGENNKRE